MTIGSIYFLPEKLDVQQGNALFHTKIKPSKKLLVLKSNSFMPNLETFSTLIVAAIMNEEPL